MNQRLLIIVNIMIGGSSVLHTPQPQVGRLSTYNCLCFPAYPVGIFTCFPTGSLWRLDGVGRVLDAVGTQNVGYYCYLFCSSSLCCKQRNDLEQLEYAPLLAASMCFPLPCPLPRVHPPASASKLQMCFLQCHWCQWSLSSSPLWGLSDLSWGIYFPLGIEICFSLLP